MRLLRKSLERRLSSPDVETPPEVVSPELALVDPTLRDLALKQLDAPAAGAPTAAVGTGRAPDSIAGHERAGGDLRTRAGRGRRIRNYVLAASLLANLFLIGIVVSGFLSSSSSVAREGGAPASTRSVDAATASTASLDATAAAFAPPATWSGLATTTTARPSTQRRSPPPVDRVVSGARTAVRAPRAARAAKPAVKGRAVTRPARGAVRRTVPRANDARPRPSAGPRLATTTAAAPMRVTRSRERAERDVLEFIRRSGELRRFVDSSTRLVRANVSVRCTPASGPLGASRASAFTCRVWQQPRPRSTGATVDYAARSGSRYAVTVRAPGAP
jgi:hypothetical protein